MRIGKVCKIRWEDLNHEHKTVIVRDRKDPRKKEGNHMIVPLLAGSFDLIAKQSETEERIFPYNSKSVTAGFQRVRKSLGVTDLRREGASRLFEKGYSIEEVAQVTGHRNLNILWQVYTQLFPHKLHDKFIYIPKGQIDPHVGDASYATQLIRENLLSVPQNNNYEHLCNQNLQNLLRYHK